GAVVAAWRLALAWIGHRGLAFLSAALLALSGPLLWGALSAMEVTLAALLVTGALLAHTMLRPWAAGVLIALAVLARPEAGLLMPLIWLAGPPSARRTAALAIPALV